MKTLDLSKKKFSIEELLKMAASGSIRILAPDGHAFVLEDADDFGKEVQLLGGSRKLRSFLKARSKEPATTSLEEYRRSLN